jgi:hypothetical protein
MILVIRGHIRDSFKTQGLFDFVKEIQNICPDLKIFIHTWNIFANSISWRRIGGNNTNVNEEVIYNYFGDLKSCIQHIIIDDDKNIELIGNLNGNINNGPMPIIGWKNYLYGKYKIMDYIFNQNLYHSEIIVNTRFDILNNSNIFSKDLLIDFIKENIGTQFTKNKFLFNKEHNGIDNIYIGNINTQHKLTKTFYYELDDILSKNSDVKCQERLIYRINEQILDCINP